MAQRFILTSICLLTGVLLTVLAPGLVRGEDHQGEVIEEPTGEIFSGGNLTGNSWISWTGLVKSLSGDRSQNYSGKLYGEGFRLRVLGAYGQYGFISGDRPNMAHPALLEVTPGYQFRSGPFISKIYMGLHGEQHFLARPVPGNKLAKRGYGFKVLSENWINLPMNSFASLDASFSTLNTSYQGMFRAGSAKFIERLSLGPELQIVGNEEIYQLRLGGFARWKLANGQIEASAGYTRNFDKKNSPYFSASWLKRF